MIALAGFLRGIDGAFSGRLAGHLAGHLADSLRTVLILPKPSTACPPGKVPPQSFGVDGGDRRTSLEAGDSGEGM